MSETAVNGSQTALWQAAGMRPCGCGCGTLVGTGHGRSYVDPAHRLRAWARRQAARPPQRALPGESRVERAFREWIESPAGRHVEAEVARLALEDQAAGDRRGEINLYLALVRRASRGLTKDREGFVCNNNHRSLLARRLMASRPELQDFFRTRDLRGVR